jgi:hypothetical protein
VENVSDFVYETCIFMPSTGIGIVMGNLGIGCFLLASS